MREKIYLVNFSHGDFFNKQRVYNTFSAKHIAKFDEVFEFGLTDIDNEFLAKNKLIFEQKKGLGLWLWKPYFINKVIDIIEEGDYLFHCDSSSVFIKSIRPLVTALVESGQDMMFFELPLEESNWTMPKVFELLQVNDKDRLSNQVSASFFLTKKTKESVAFLREWLELCREPSLMIYDEADAINNCKGHRYDQSLLSILAKKHKYQLFRDPSQYGEFPEMYRNNSKIRPRTFKNSNYKSTILLLRRSKVFNEYLKFNIKRILKTIFPSIYLKIIS